MAFNKETFRTRTLTAVVFVIVMAAGLLWNKWSFFILFSVVHFGCWMEYKKIVEKIDAGYQPVNGLVLFLIMFTGWCAMLFFTNNELVIAGAHLSRQALWIGMIGLIVTPLVIVLKDPSAALKNSAHTLLGYIYISLSLALLVNLRNRWTNENADLNLTIPLFIIFTLWINDTMAYLVGSFIGKTQLSPISPKKTWEGTIGGALLAVVIMSTIAYATGKLALVHAISIATITALSGTCGDLFESKLKRLAGIKDSGTFMPGHGGFLDRFDSLLFAATTGWVYCAFFLPPGS